MMSLSQLIKEFGVRKFLSKESLEQMRIMYEDKMLSTVEIGKFFNLSDHTVAVRLKELGVNVTKKRSKKITNRRYFENIDSSRKAYFLGLIVADGSVIFHKNKYAFRIELVSSDDYLIKELVKDLGADESVVKVSQRINRNKTSYVSFGDELLVNDLAKYGVVPNKTFTAYFPDIPSEFYRDFIRGYFDGDGTVYMCGKYVRTAFYGNASIIKAIKNFLMQDIGLSDLTICNRGNHVSFHMGSQTVLQRFFNLYYKDSDIYMVRKYKLLAALFSNE